MTDFTELLSSSEKQILAKLDVELFTTGIYGDERASHLLQILGGGSSTGSQRLLSHLKLQQPPGASSRRV
jgi:hypothetical protein